MRDLYSKLHVYERYSGCVTRARTKIFLVPWDVPTTTVHGDKAIIKAGIASVINGSEGRDVVSHGSQVLISEDQFQRLVKNGQLVKRGPKLQRRTSNNND